MQLSRKFEPLFKGAYDSHRIICYYGGRGGGKSYAISYFAILQCLKNQICFYIVRKIDKSKTNSTHALIKRLIRELGFLDYIESISAERISFLNGSEIVFKGVSPITIDNIRSADNVRYFWFEECHDIEAEIIQVLIPSIRAESSQILLSLNPQRSDDYIYQTFIKGADDDYSVAIKVNYYDNPFYPAVLERDRIRDYNTLPRPIYLHIWEGEANDYNDLAVIDSDRITYYDDSAQHAYQILIASIDTATSTKTGADYSVVGIFGKTQAGDTHLIHLARGQWDWHTLQGQIQNAIRIGESKAGKGVNKVLIEAKANGLNVIQELQRLTHLQVQGVTPKVDKLSRVVNDMLPYIDRLKLPQNATDPFNFWVNDYIRECKQFRADGKHEHDDMIDSTSQALNFLYNSAMNFNNIRKALTI